jgi:hypothetical protein
METVVGFVAGYLAGCRDGEEGLARLRESLKAIRDSPETRRMAGQAAALAGGMLQRAVGQAARGGASLAGLGGTVDTVSDLLGQRGRGPGRRAA